MQKDKLSAKDLILVGIITVLYFIAFMISGLLGAAIPVITVIIPFVLGILGAVPFMILVSRTGKFGAVTILGTLMGILCFFMGQDKISIPFGLVFGLSGDLILRCGAYKSWKTTVLGYMVFTEWVMGSMLPMWIMRDVFFEKYKTVGEEYMETVKSLTANWMLPVVVVLGLVGAVIGAYMAKGILKKHFKRAGLI